MINSFGQKKDLTGVEYQSGLYIDF